jgi:diaminopimelate decarboxylase
MNPIAAANPHPSLNATGPDFKQKVLQSAIASGYLNDEQPLAAFIDTDSVRKAISALMAAFPDHFEHFFAAKANSMLQALRLVKDCGMGCEVASRGELEQAFRAGFEPGRIVYDEPTKTESVLRMILQQGIDLNLDNLQEFERVKRLLAERATRSRIGFRINPQIGAGRISAMSTATATSKFGVPIEDDGMRRQLLQTYRNNPWLTTVHTHIGSQGCEFDLMIAGIRRVIDLAEEINATTNQQQVRVVDIGGGLPVNFESETVNPTYRDYSEQLRQRIPELFSGKYAVKTEFGRSLFAKSGFIIARVEYTKTSGGRPIALTHAGVQVATRTVFMPEHWKLRLSVFDSSGRQRSGNEVRQDVAGPCCFAGDMIATDRLLPLIEPGDFVMLHDTGGYYFSCPYYYNTLAAPAVYAASRQNEGVGLAVWRKQQTMDDLLAVIG